MRERAILFFFVCLAFSSEGQFNQSRRNVDVPQDTMIQNKEAHIFESSAEFKGGMTKFYKYISKKQRYPKDAKQLGIEGKVFVEFVVEKDGSIPYNSVKIVRGLSESIDNEVLRIIRESPKWIPGRMANSHEPVAQKLILPMFFKL